MVAELVPVATSDDKLEVEDKQDEDDEEDVDTGVDLRAGAPRDDEENVVLNLVRNLCCTVSTLFTIHLCNSSQVPATLLSLTYNSG
jgi:hypothetical protein